MVFSLSWEVYTVTDASTVSEISEKGRQTNGLYSSVIMNKCICG